MSGKKTMTLNLTANEMEGIELLASEKGISKTALVKQALRMYQSIDGRIVEGEKVFFENPITKEKAELLLL